MEYISYSWHNAIGSMMPICTNICEAQVLPAYRSPWQNAYVQRLDGSIRRECTDHVIVFGENHLRRILRAYFAYYHDDRSHPGLDKETPIERPILNRASPSSRLLELPRLGGFRHRYEWSEAA